MRDERKPKEVRVRVYQASDGSIITECSVRFNSGLRRVGSKWGASKVKAEDLAAFLMECEMNDTPDRDAGIDPPALLAFLDEKRSNLKN